ncbi:undecaprenyldiphospho-muramoylpentapeptide beta-N-acetylglucosaminyltransferase [Pararhizobium haloflavum]|uniref:undecaprenyldiphospho-muramoylpentapeptide beta-N-acetylglucosaminyltransferase n=1 Tax=Pararhizobium haloflavum TaxID=2037914 RepID=UPI000C19D40A|nr:undecaprenyldiphospho-muramoylpentapeptide beta-N-acetylglucosaminyltransferase [Pararhizobium haloflavum]
MSDLILLSAGGTGGHLFPAEALAHELRRRGHAVDLVTDERAARYAQSFPADHVHVVRSATISSKNPIAAARSLLTLVSGIRQSGKLIRRLRPAAVVGFGGYPTLPPVYAATRAGVPTMIHEQNAVMGRANRLLASRVDAIAGGFLPEGSGAHQAKTVTTGNPVRPAVLEAAASPYRAAHGSERFNLVVFGGSQGARFFSESIPAALDLLTDEERSRLVVTQQARREDEAEVTAFYRTRGIEADVSPFFADMAARIGAAQLVISRSGASTVSEISVIGRPAILVPYPHALDHDQAANAAALMAKGGAEVIAQSALSSTRLADLIGSAMREPDRLAETAGRARAAGKPDAAALLASMVEAIADGMSITAFKDNRA